MQIIEGQVSIEAVLESGFRKVDAIWLNKNKRRDKYRKILSKAKQKKIPVKMVTGDQLAQKATGKSHGGIIAFVTPREFSPVEDLIKGKEACFIAMIDGIEDPYNFGFAVRSLYASGCDGLIVRPRNWMDSTTIVARSSAGATERIAMSVMETAEDAASFFQSHGFEVFATSNRDAEDLYDVDLTGKVFLFIGGEKRGVTRSFLNHCDRLLRIPYGRDYSQSISAEAAAAVIGFEISRQKRRKQ
jgi:23S rRNA (guanosine2251-2'-O)-methyltransferase